MPGVVDDAYQRVPAEELDVGDIVLVEAGDLIPADGEVIEGIAMVNESAITGESAPVIREAGGDRSAVTGGTKVVSDRIKVKVTVGVRLDLPRPHDRDGRRRRAAANAERAGAVDPAVGHDADLPDRGRDAVGPRRLFGHRAVDHGADRAAGDADPDHHRRPALGDRHRRHGPARPLQCARDLRPGRRGRRRRRHPAARQDRHHHFRQPQATEVIAVPGVSEREVAEAALLASLADETAEGRSIVTLMQENIVSRRNTAAPDAKFIAFSATTRLSGLDIGGRKLRKGAVDAVLRFAREQAGRDVHEPAEFRAAVDRIARTGGTPLGLADGGRLLGVIHLKDVVKPTSRSASPHLRRMGIRTVMVTGDNPVTAAAIASEAGVDDFIAEATPEDKLRYIRDEQAKGRLIAMCGDGTNDAPALAQADVGVAMQTGTQPAREAGNMVDLDSDPTKLIEVVEIGKQLLMTRGSLTTFSIANDVAKYFAIIPALFVVTYPRVAGAQRHGALDARRARSCRR